MIRVSDCGAVWYGEKLARLNSATILWSLRTLFTRVKRAQSKAHPGNLCCKMPGSRYEQAEKLSFPLSLLASAVFASHMHASQALLYVRRTNLDIACTKLCLHKEYTYDGWISWQTNDFTKRKSKTFLVTLTWWLLRICSSSSCTPGQGDDIFADHQ